MLLEGIYGMFQLMPTVQHFKQLNSLAIKKFIKFKIDTDFEWIVQLDSPKTHIALIKLKYAVAIINLIFLINFYDHTIFEHKPELYCVLKNQEKSTQSDNYFFPFPSVELNLRGED